MKICVWMTAPQWVVRLEKKCNEDECWDFRGTHFFYHYIFLLQWTLEKEISRCISLWWWLSLFLRFRRRHIPNTHLNWIYNFKGIPQLLAFASWVGLFCAKLWILNETLLPRDQKNYKLWLNGILKQSYELWSKRNWLGNQISLAKHSWKCLIHSSKEVH